MWNDRYSAEGLSLFGRAVFDPGTLMLSSMAATAVGGGLTAAGTLAGGNFAKTAGQMQQSAAQSEALQIEDNASQAFASNQREALDTEQKTRLAISTAKARGAASGVDIGTGSPATNVGEIAQRGSYQALTSMFNGESAATGLRNKAAAVRYGGDLSELEGEEKQSASRLSALGTLAGSAGSMFSTYGKYTYPTSRGSFGA